MILDWVDLIAPLLFHIRRILPSVVICEECYCAIDNRFGVEAIGFNSFNLAGVSRLGKGTIIDEAKYVQFQRREAIKLGIDLQGPN